MREDSTREEKVAGGDIKLGEKSRFLSWLDNFWYHHKWKVIIITFFAVVLIVGVVQMINKTDADINVTVATPNIHYRENVDSLESALVALMPSDRNGDGEKNVLLKTYKVYSEDEMDKANNAETDADGNPVIYADAQYNKEQIDALYDYIGMGECSVMLVSEYFYNELVTLRDENKMLYSISEIYGDKLPDGVMPDGYGIRLSETGAYKHFDAFKTLPEDTVICLMRPVVFTKGSNAERQSFAKEYFMNIVDYGKE